MENKMSTSLDRVDVMLEKIQLYTHVQKKRDSFTFSFLALTYWFNQIVLFLSCDP